MVKRAVMVGLASATTGVLERRNCGNCGMALVVAVDQAPVVAAAEQVELLVELVEMVGLVEKVLMVF